VGDFSLSKNACNLDKTYVTFTMDPVIKQCEEHIHKSYYDWIAAISGLLSLLLFAFFRISVFMTDYFATHEWNMGLLSMMSPIFRNREFFWMKDQLVEKIVIKNPNCSKGELDIQEL